MIPKIKTISRAGDKFVVQLDPEQTPYPHGQLIVVLLTVDQARRMAKGERCESDVRAVIDSLKQQLREF